MNIQELLNNNIIKQSTMIELAINSELRCKTLDNLQKTYTNSCNLKSHFEDRLKDTHNYKKIIIELKKTQYSLKSELAKMFEYEFFYVPRKPSGIGYFEDKSLYEPPIATDDYFFQDLYYADEHNTFMLSFMEGDIYDEYYYVHSISEILDYYRHAYKNAIDHIDKIIEHTIKMITIITELHNKLINNPNILAIIKMSTM